MYKLNLTITDPNAQLNTVTEKKISRANPFNNYTIDIPQHYS